ncbi:MAG TPA: biotin carboxylase N-terminal domain-containing protein [Vicinamibacterales bacterium]|jgi:acetyl-CoA carboxylase biotin carboxylase subunit|nr:biotin carboxylase N-terminal domain-containing protein [Vicinamibacterales bacterium]
MIRRVLIANRGEIALRIIQACREMNIETIAVFSDADARAPHVLAADRAVAIGPAPAIQSYLSIPTLISAARAERADAVHPGYGFLSESAAFARACEQAGVVFVGPPSEVISRMGSKIEARQLMQSAGVPIVPGHVPHDQSDSGVRRALEEIGFPALVKASAGGGGKGMRVVEGIAEATGAVQAARREAVASFGDGTLYVERLLDRPRHVEVQVFADAFGHTTHLFERECSAQRRHQKVLEESPSPALTPALRQRMTQAAVAAARAAEYRNAGTIEFLVEGRGDGANFYFLEMNTRLQVEHAVTEAVVGVDLVRAQLLVASGEPLPWEEGSLAQRGHAIEARVYAEDPSREFLPQAGRLLLYREPRMPGVRVDAGVAEGHEVTVHYDPMLAKVIAVGETRDAAISRLAAALRAYPVLGIRTNIPYLLAVLDHSRFRSGDIDTSFLDREAGDLVHSVPEPPAFLREALRQLGDEADEPRTTTHEANTDPWLTLRDWRA